MPGYNAPSKSNQMIESYGHMGEMQRKYGTYG